MLKGIKIGFLIISLGIIIFGCTTKTNLTGTEGQEGPIPIEITITSDMFSEIYSFEDSVRNLNSDNLLVGNYNSNNFDNKAVLLLKFTSLVDTFYQVENAKISLKISEKYNFNVIDNTTLKIGKMKTNWFEAVANWNEPTDSTSWNGDQFSLEPDEDIELIDDLNLTFEGDSLLIEIPNEMLENWILADSLNYGLALYAAEDDKFIDFHSAEYGGDDSPKLYFDYAETVEDTLITYYRTPTHDLHICATDNEYTVYQNALIISNLQPIRMLAKFAIPNNIFTDNSTENIEDTLAYLQRLTINKADLVLSFESDNPYPVDLNSSLNIDPYIMISDTLNLTDNTIPMIADDDYEDLYITSSNDSLDSSAFKVDITSIVQNIISGEYENKGIMLKSIYENYDFKHTNFNVQPQIIIVFTPPNLDD